MMISKDNKNGSQIERIEDDDQVSWTTGWLATAAPPSPGSTPSSAPPEDLQLSLLLYLIYEPGC
jgi:hypothetical protein